MTHPDQLAVVLIHWNQPERCLTAVDAWQAQGVRLRMRIVDNGSEPDALAALRSGLSTDVELIEAGTNLGFGPGANVGLRAWLADDETEWVAVAPHDALPQPGCLDHLLGAVSERPLAGLACADVGDGFRPVTDRYFGGMYVPMAAGSGWQPADYPHGTLFVARRACLEEVGLFDERYFASCEEADLGERARAAGWAVGIVRDADVRNPAMAGGNAVVDYLMLRNTLLLVREHFGPYHASVRFGLALYQLGMGSIRPDQRSMWGWSPRARVRALADFATGHFGPPPDALRG